VNFTWSRAFDTGSANRGGDFLTNYENPYNVSKNYAPSGFDTPWNVNFTLVYDVPKVHGLPKLVGEGWSVNSLFRAQAGRPFSVYISGDPSNQGLKTSYANYDGSPLSYDFHNTEQFFNTAAFSVPDDGAIGNARRNMLRQPGISQLDVGLFKKFQLSERISAKFKWEVFNVFNHGMFAYETGKTNGSCAIDPTHQACGPFGTLFATPDVGIGLNPILGTGAQRNMQFGVAIDF
jgi:hypothetical protein